MDMVAEGPLISNQSDIGITAAVPGLGIAYAFVRERAHDHLVRGRVVEVLADWSSTRPALFL